MKYFFLGILFSVSCWAWGPTGHRVVGEIAQRNLDTSVILKIMKLTHGHSLSRISTWADEIKSEPQTYSNTFNWHYTDWPDGTSVHDETQSSGLLLKSIHEQIIILKDIQSSDDKKLVAIKFLVHLIGDLHMPLHVGNGLDLGGNTCKVLFHGHQTNLHALWDEDMIEFTNLSYTELANYVIQGRDINVVRSWWSGEIVDWAQESKNIRATLYPADMDCSQLPTALVPQLGFSYSYKFMPVIEQRLHQAGVRLALLLNSALK